MLPTLEELEFGAKAARQVRWYENTGAKDGRRTPWLFAICSGLFLIVFVLEAHFRRSTDLLYYLFIPLCFTIRHWQNQVAKAHYLNQKLLLKLLEEKYGDQLPWVMEEKQLAAAREVQAASVQSGLT